MNDIVASGLGRVGFTRMLVLLTPLLIGTTFNTAARASDKEADPALRDYLSANGMLNRGLFELAAAEYHKFLSAHADHEKAPVARYGLGVSLFRLGQYDETIKELTPLAEHSGFDFAAEVGTILGQCYLTRKQHAEAADAFKQVVRTHGGHDLADEAGAGLTEALYLEGRYDAAIDAFRDFTARWPDSPLRERAEFFGALAAMARKDYTTAAQRFAAQLERYPDGPFARQASLLLAQCHQSDNAVTKAIRQYRKVLSQAGSEYIPDALLGLATLLQHKSNPAEAAALLDQLLERFPESALTDAARLQRGRAWFDLGDYDKALGMFDRVGGEDDVLRSQAAYWMAKCKLRMEDFDAAAEEFDGAIDRFPDSDLLPEMFYDRAVALVRAQRHDAAVDALQAFRGRFPKHTLAADALQLLAVTEHHRRRYDKSRNHGRAFLEQYPSHKLAPAVAFLIGENDFLAGNFEDAVTGYRGFLGAHPDNVQADKARFRLGMALYRLQRYDEADDLLTQIADGPRTIETYRPALMALGDIHFQRGEWKQGEKFLHDYLSFGPDLASADDALLKLGLSRKRQGRNEEAIEAYEQLIDRFEDSPHRLQAMFERGQALVSLDRRDEASRAFEAVVEADGTSRFTPYALNHLAAMAARRKDFTEASQLYDRVTGSAPETGLGANALFQSAQALMAAERFKEAETVFARFTDAYPSHAYSAEADAQRAIAVARQNRHADAIKAIEQVDRKRGSTLEPSLRAALRYERAWCLRELGRLDEAAGAYRELLDEGLAGDLNVHAMLELSGIEFNAKRFEAAAERLRRLRMIIQADSTQVPRELREQATYRLAVCEFELGHFDQAAELCEEFLKTFEGSSLTASASFYCGEAWFKLGRHQKAVKHLTRIAEDFDTDPVVGPSLLRLGESLAALQRWARSERIFTQYINRFEGSDQWFQAQFGIGWARENQKRYDEAISAYRTVVARHQGSTAARAQFQIGECLFAKKQYEPAVRELLKVDILYAYPEWSAAALYEAGRCFARLGKTVEARAHFKQVSEQYGQTHWAELASQRLTELTGASLPGR